LPGLPAIILQAKHKSFEDVFVTLPLSFPFSQLFYAHHLLHFIFVLAAIKSWVLIMDKAWKWDLDQL